MRRCGNTVSSPEIRFQASLTSLPRYNPIMRRTLIAYVLLLALGVQSLFGGTGVVVCLGGGHEHGPAEIDHCESVCSHDSSWPIPLPAGDHDDDCGCEDLELQVSELPTLPRTDFAAPDVVVVAHAASWGIIVADAGLGRRGPPLRPPPWFDPSGEQRLKLVSSVVLTI